MKIIILFLLIGYLVAFFFACNMQPPQPQKRDGIYQLTQTYYHSKNVGTIDFYDSSHFRTNISAVQNSYSYKNISVSQVECFEIGGNAHFTFTVMNVSADSEKWQCVVNGTLLVWEFKK